MHQHFKKHHLLFGFTAVWLSALIPLFMCIPASAQSSAAQNLSSFKPLGRSVVKTFYQVIPGTDHKTTVTGRCDFNGDGKKDALSLRYQDPTTGGKSILKVGRDTIVTDEFMYLSGVYALRLNKADKFRELAVCAYGTDDDVFTYFYRYTGSGLQKIGTLYGSVQEKLGKGYPHTSLYNYTILSNGRGTLIPRMGVMQYVSPSILLSAYTFQKDEFKAVKLDYTAVYKQKHTLTMAVKPYFETMKVWRAGYTEKFESKDVITIKKGTVLRIHKVSSSMVDSLASLVTLPNGRTGLLYFFVHP